MAPRVKKNATVEAAPEPETIAVEDGTVEIELCVNESVEERKNKRLVAQKENQSVLAAHINAFVLETFGLDVNVVVHATSFVMESETFIEDATDAVLEFFRTFDTSDLIANTSFTMFSGNVTLNWYDIDTEYGSIEAIDEKVQEWRRANPTSIAETVTASVLEDLGLHVRVVDNTGEGEPYGVEDNVLKAVYIQIAARRDESNQVILATRRQKPVPLASAKDEDNGEDWAVDLLHSKRYPDDEAFETALIEASAKAKTILATRYGVAAQEQTRVVRDEDEIDLIDEPGDEIPAIDD